MVVVQNVIPISPNVSRNSVKAYLAMFTAMAIWSAAFAGQRVLVDHFSPLLVTELRAFAVAIFFGAVLLYQGKRRPAIDRNDLATMIFLGIEGIVLLYIIQYTGLSLTNATITAVLVLGTGPIFSTILAAVLLRERLNKQKIAAVFLGALGVLVIVSQNGLAVGAGPGFLLGGVLCLVSAICWAFYCVVGRRILQRNSAFTVSSRANIAAAVVLLPMAAFTPGWDSVANMPLGDWLVLAYLVLACTAIGHVLWYFGLTHIEASKVAIWSNLQVPFAALAGMVLLGEPLTAQTMVGGLVIVASVYMVVFSPSST